MLQYNDFLEIAKYANENWRGCFTDEEVKENADCYYSDYIFGIEHNEKTNTIETLISLLKEDIDCGEESETVKNWIKKLEA